MKNERLNEVLLIRNLVRYYLSNKRELWIMGYMDDFVNVNNRHYCSTIVKFLLLDRELLSDDDIILLKLYDSSLYPGISKNCYHCGFFLHCRKNNSVYWRCGKREKKCEIDCIFSLPQVISNERLVF